MSVTEVVVEGTLKPDGTLELNEKPGLSPGRVVVVLRQQSAPVAPTGDWWQFMQDARKRMEQTGSRFLDEAELKARIEQLREDDRIDELLRDADAQRKKSERS